MDGLRSHISPPLPTETLDPGDIYANNPMLATLDSGELTPRNQDRDFTVFLDLKRQHHKEFMDRLRDLAINDEEYDLDALYTDEAEREVCAVEFLQAWGREYWGTDANRRRYLIEERLGDTKGLACLPDREDEIKRALMILIERKSKKDWRGAGGSGLADTSALDQTTGDSTIFFESRMDKGNNKKRKKSGIGFEGSILSNVDTNTPLRSHREEPSNGATHGIRPFSSISSPEARKKDKKKRRKSKDASMAVDEVVEETRQPAPEPSKTTSTVYRTSRPGIEQGQKETYFLVSATSQLEIEPVWLPYKNFRSASAFLAAMADELNLHEWNPTAQLNKEISYDARENLVASVRFEWADFGIRVRQGQDRDWEFVKRELERSWIAKHGDDGEEGQPQPGRFTVRVMLHVGN